MSNTFNATNPQSPVPVANPIECDARTPATNGSIARLSTATMGMAEYTTTNLADQLNGDLITAGFYGNVYRVHLNSSGTGVVSLGVLFSNVGSYPIDVAVQNNSDAYPGTIWVTDFGDGTIHVFEPADF
jgi:large repetitive protein